MRKKNSRTLEDTVIEYVEYWRDILKLRDWEFTVKIIDDPEDGFANVQHYPNIQLAKIQVLSPGKIPADWPGCKDVEVSVVHEMLHTRFHHCMRINKKADAHEEMAIERCAQVMVALRRGITPEELD